jgi:hypothetical protein
MVLVCNAVTASVAAWRFGLIQTASSTIIPSSSSLYGVSGESLHPYAGAFFVLVYISLNESTLCLSSFEEQTERICMSCPSVASLSCSRSSSF